jgi:pimeloyl-ACP methyl ester carboxylesterase
VVRGDGDRWVPAEGARALAASIPGAEGPVTVPDGHHNPQVTRPEAVLPVVEDFLDRLDWRR